MTFSDQAQLDRAFADAIFSGVYSPQPAELARQFVEVHQLPMPGFVVVTQGVAEADDAVSLRLHEGMYYLAGRQPKEMVSALDAAGIVRGTPFPYASPEHFLTQLREAIVSLRQAELRVPVDGRVIPHGEELQSRALALRELRETGRAGSAFEAWLELVFQRHRRYLHQLRLRLLEMVTALSSAVDGLQPLAYLVQSSCRRVLDTYALPRLREVAREACAEIAAMVALQEPGPAGADSPLIRRALAVMNARFTEPISLAEVAAACHASPEHLARQFRRHRGRTVVEALQLLRVNHARELLAESSRTVLDIAFSSGFESAEHFYRTFRKHTGASPAAYRRGRHL